MSRNCKSEAPQPKRQRSAVFLPRSVRAVSPLRMMSDELDDLRGIDIRGGPGALECVGPVQ
eukprot:13436329-Alexandrium_andersonii.AAC.1